jgi:hypothetical protein
MTPRQVKPESVASREVGIMQINPRRGPGLGILKVAREVINGLDKFTCQVQQQCNKF